MRHRDSRRLLETTLDRVRRTEKGRDKVTQKRLRGTERQMEEKGRDTRVKASPTTNSQIEKKNSNQLSTFLKKILIRKIFNNNF